jgi:hypothetical protein
MYQVSILKAGMGKAITPHGLLLRNPFACNMEEARDASIKANMEEAKILEELTRWL